MLALVALLIGCRLAVSRRPRIASPAQHVEGRLALFVAGVVVLVVALIGPLDWLGERRLMAAHMVQHILLISVVPALLILGFPSTGRSLRGRVARPSPSWAAPTALLVGGVVGILALHAPPVLDAGLRYRALNDLQHLPLLVAGLAIAWPLVGSRRLRGLGAVAYLGVAELGIGILGVWLTWYPHVVYATYEQLPRLWGLSARTDQAVAGAILLVAEEPFLAVEVAVLFIRALQESEEAS